MKHSWLRHALASSAVYAFAATGHAQTAASESDTTKATGAKLGEIIVTAQRRSENLQTVPIAITSANAEALATARVENISNIAAVSPSISFRATNISSSIASFRDVAADIALS